MRISGVPLVWALLSLGCLCLASEASSSTTSASTADSSASPATSSSSSSSSTSSSSGKPKRDAGLSFSSYHGPSHKYLPPAYEGHHQLSYHGGGGGGFGGSYHGNSLSSYASDYGHLESESGNGNHHYHQGYGYARPHPHHHHQQHYVPSPKIETYIVQTTSNGHGYHGSHGLSGGNHGLSRGSHGFSAGSHGLSGGSHSLSGGSHILSGGSHSLSGGSHGLSGGSHGFSAGSHSLSGGSHGLGGGSHILSGGSHGLSGGSHGLSGGSHGLSGGSHGPRHSFSHGSLHGLGYKYPAPGAGSASSAYLNLLGGGGGGGHKTSTYLVASPEYVRPNPGYSQGFGHHQISSSSSHGPSSLEHSLEHALEHGLTHALGLGLGHSSGSHGGPVFAQHPLPQPPAEEHSSGYTYDAPAIPFGKGTPLTSYGVPLIPGYDHHQQQQQQEENQILEQEHKLEREQERETPVYALGHKGLGHFSYTASKPQALHTDVLGGGNGGGVAGGDLSELTKAPFKPSAFLGAKHESSSGSVTNSISGYDYATPTSPYLQQAPSSPGYDYQATAAQQLYGPPGHSGDSATPIFEPEATYLPPVSSYGPPATSSHGGYH